MKLIIDIDEELYKNVKEYTKNGGVGSDLWNAVAKSIPYEEKTQGKWICDKSYLDCRCSICNSYALERGDYPELSSYCPACGAKMEDPHD